MPTCATTACSCFFLFCCFCYDEVAKLNYVRSTSATINRPTTARCEPFFFHRNFFILYIFHLTMDDYYQSVLHFTRLLHSKLTFEREIYVRRNEIASTNVRDFDRRRPPDSTGTVTLIESPFSQGKPVAGTALDRKAVADRKRGSTVVQPSFCMVSSWQQVKKEEFF